ncbi:MAG: OmpA family protein [Chitinophagales bacterium]|nr:OmpA family protein [Chitinophagales bacterium]
MKKQKLFFSLIIISVLFCSFLQAQNESVREALAVRYIGNNFHWPLEQGHGFDDEDFTYGLEFEYFRSLNNTLDLSFPIRLIAADHPLTSDGSQIKEAGNMGLDMLLNLNLHKGKVFQPRIFGGFGGLLLDMEDLSLDIPVGLGLDFYVAEGFALSTTFAYHFNDTDLRDHVLVGVGFRVDFNNYEEPEPIILDRDGDGIIDAEDLCPDDAGTAALNGCPDKDGDGISDNNDECPDEAGPADNNGCPITDRDGDGIDDDEDECPDVIGTIANNGCPEKSVVIVAKDKISGEVLPNAEVVLLSGDGQVIKTGTTNSLGIVEFANVQPNDYTIEGKLYDVSLLSEGINTSEFNTAEQVQKVVYYDDPNFIVQGKVFLCNTPSPLPGVTLNLKNSADNFMKSTISDQQGQYIFHLSARATYELYAKKENYLSQVVNVDANNYNRSKSVFVKLEVCAEEVECGEAIRLNNILYDLNSTTIRPDARPDLNKLVQFMADNPKATVELSSHTDSRGSATYNLQLSQGRADSAVEYIVSQGVTRSRISAKGYGETKLLNNCADGTNCSESEHQLNRRTEFKVVCDD